MNSRHRHLNSAVRLRWPSAQKEANDVAGPWGTQFVPFDVLIVKTENNWPLFFAHNIQYMKLENNMIVAENNQLETINENYEIMKIHQSILSPNIFGVG